MPSRQADNDFASEMEGQIVTKVDTNTLDVAIGWIASNLKPDEVFDEDDLRKHVAHNGLPQDVFSISELEEWAESNGYTKE